MKDLIQRLLDIEEEFLGLKTELLGDPNDAIDVRAAVAHIEEMERSLKLLNSGPRVSQFVTAGEAPPGLDASPEQGAHTVSRSSGSAGGRPPDAQSPAVTVSRSHPMMAFSRSRLTARSCRQGLQHGWRLLPIQAVRASRSDTGYFAPIGWVRGRPHHHPIADSLTRRRGSGAP
jgi:hypothetical protein